jgi:hypothetical protein
VMGAIPQALPFDSTCDSWFRAQVRTIFPNTLALFGQSMPRYAMRITVNLKQTRVSFQES